MARKLYAASPADYVINSGTGMPASGVTVTIYSAVTGGSQVTDLQTTAGQSISTVTTDAQGGFRFLGPDNSTATLWASVSGGLNRFAVNVGDISAEFAEEVHAHTGFVPTTLADAKGDLFAASAPDVVTRLAVGQADQVLTVDAAQPTGMKWATPVSSIHSHDIAAVTNLQTELYNLSDGLSQKADTTHSHASSPLTLENLPPGALFVINFVSSVWKYNGDTISSRPSNRADIRMWAVGGSTPPNFGLTHDMHSPETT